MPEAVWFIWPIPEILAWLISIFIVALAAFHIVVMWTLYKTAHDARDYFQRRRRDDELRILKEHAARKAA